MTGSITPRLNSADDDDCVSRRCFANLGRRRRLFEVGCSDEVRDPCPEFDKGTTANIGTTRNKSRNHTRKKDPAMMELL